MNVYDEKIKTITDVYQRSKLEAIVSNLITVFAFVAFGFIAIMSIVQTCVIDPDAYEVEHILFNTDNIILNLAIILIVFTCIIMLNKSYDFFAKVNMKFMYAGLFVYVIALGFVWIFSVWQIPAADSANIFESATEFIKGDYSSLYFDGDSYFKEFYNNYSYYDFYPFQLGFVFICEVVYRIFGADSSMPIQVINVICVALAYCGIAKISKFVFKRKSIEFFTIILLLGCLQPILLCTFAYGNIIGMCCGIWASYFLIKYLQTNKYIMFLPCTILLAISVMAKYNNLIYAVAFAIILFVHTIKHKKWQSIACAMALFVVAFSINNVIVMSYEKRADVDLRDGVSQASYLAMGLSEAYSAPGWYSPDYMGYYKNFDFDENTVSYLISDRLNVQMTTFASNPIYTIKFFGSKVLSQWNEPTYESIWISKTKDHIKDLNALATSVYDGNAGVFLDFYFNQYMQILFVLFTAGCICLFAKKKANLENILLILVLLGGFGYHLLCEAKSQYSTTYLILMIPMAAYGIQSLFIDNGSKFKKLLDK